MSEEWRALLEMFWPLALPVMAFSLRYLTRFRGTGAMALLQNLGVQATWTRGGAEGVMRGVPVRVTFSVRQKSEHEYNTWMTIEARGVSPDLNLARQGAGQSLLKSLGGQDIEVGDPRFDDAVMVRGDPQVARALLSYEVRHDARHLLEADGEIVGGVVRYTVLGHTTDAQYGGMVVERAVRLAQALSPERATRARLLEQVRDDLCPRVRQRCLLELWERGPRELLERALTCAQADPEIEVSGTAALIRGDREIILTLPDDVIQEAASIAPQRAGRALGEAGHEEALLALLERGATATKVGAARGLHRAGSRRAVEALRRQISGVTVEAELKSACNSAIGAIQSRLQGSASAGSISLLDTDTRGGALSLGEERGQISIHSRRGQREGN